MTLPTQPGRTPAIYKAATTPPSDPAHGAAFIFLHGLGDSAEGLESKYFKLFGNRFVSTQHSIGGSIS